MITNKYNYPPELVEFAKSHYKVTPNRYSATTLLKPIPQIILSRRHHGEADQDVSENTWAIFGSLTHILLERTPVPGRVHEMFLTVPFEGSVISGQIDVYDMEKRRIEDWKTTTVYKPKSGDYEEYRKQLFIYAWMMRKSGFPVDSVQITMILRDHHSTEAKIKADYPDLPVVTVDWPFTDRDFERTENWIQERLKRIKAAEALSDEELGYCSKEERWNTTEKWALKKKGVQKAVKLFNTEQEAKDYIPGYLKAKPKIKETDLYIEHRPGEDRRCDGYCSARPWCSLWKHSPE